jgi:hypothetical protein
MCVGNVVGTNVVGLNEGSVVGSSVGSLVGDSVATHRPPTMRENPSKHSQSQPPSSSSIAIDDSVSHK